MGECAPLDTCSQCALHSVLVSGLRRGSRRQKHIVAAVVFAARSGRTELRRLFCTESVWARLTFSAPGVESSDGRRADQLGPTRALDSLRHRSQAVRKRRHSRRGGRLRCSRCLARGLLRGGRGWGLPSCLLGFIGSSRAKSARCLAGERLVLCRPSPLGGLFAKLS